MRRFLGLILSSALVVTACGGGAKAPTSPSNSSASGATSPATGSATIRGTVTGGTNSLTAGSTGAAIAGLTVSVVGTSISSGLDATGRFSLANVPAGAAQLRVTGGGTDSTLTLRPVQAADTVELVVVVSGSAAAISSEVRNGQQVPTTSAEAEAEGAIDTLSGSASAFQFKIGSRVVHGDTTTLFTAGGGRTASFASLKNGVVVEVKGQQRDTFILATTVHVEDGENQPGDDNGDDDGDDHGGNQGPGTASEVRGTLKTIAGSKPTLTLTIDTTTVHTTASTEVKQHGTSLTFDALKVGQNLHVNGTRQADGSLTAREVEIEDENENEDEFRVEGAMSALSGTCPSIKFTVAGNPVSTSATTRFDDGCTGLKNGDSIEVRGSKQTNGTVAATRVRRR